MKDVKKRRYLIGLNFRHMCFPHLSFPRDCHLQKERQPLALHGSRKLHGDPWICLPPSWIQLPAKAKKAQRWLKLQEMEQAHLRHRQRFTVHAFPRKPKQPARTHTKLDQNLPQVCNNYVGCKVLCKRTRKFRKVPLGSNPPENVLRSQKHTAHL